MPDIACLECSVHVKFPLQYITCICHSTLSVIDGFHAALRHGLYMESFCQNTNNNMEPYLYGGIQLSLCNILLLFVYSFFYKYHYGIIYICGHKNITMESYTFVGIKISLWNHIHVWA